MKTTANTSGIAKRKDLLNDGRPMRRANSEPIGRSVLTFCRERSYLPNTRRVSMEQRPDIAWWIDPCAVRA
jgi:hypothetical protein